MHFNIALLTLSLSTLTYAIPIPNSLFALRPREVPQEHSHNAVLASVQTSLQLNNPAGIKDSVFGLLGNKAAAAGQGSISNTDCLKQATADQAFTNAKAAKDVKGMTNALIYQALERNTAKVGQASVACTAIKAKNPEIAAVGVHQDPASAGAAATNKASTLALAKQIAAVGGDPQDALKAGTFKPGDLTDATGKGNSCDTADDKEGCIFSQNLLVPDATAAEIAAAAGGKAAAAPAGATGAAGVAVASGTAAAAMSTGTGGASAMGAAAAGAPFANGTAANDAGAAAATGTAAAAMSMSSGGSSAGKAADSTVKTSCDAAKSAGDGAKSNNGAAASKGAAANSGSTSTTGTNVQTFTGALGGAPPPVIKSDGKRPFAVNGSTFVNAGAALQRSCAVQHNACADAANSGKLGGGVGVCDKQEGECNAAAKAG